MSLLENSGVLTELEKGIIALSIAHQFIPENHPQKPAYLSILGNSLRMRFERLGEIADIDEAIMAQQQAVRITPDGHPRKPGRLNNLGNAWATLPISTKRSRLSSRPFVLPQMVLETPSLSV
jgi:hypothetical protein